MVTTMSMTDRPDTRRAPSIGIDISFQTIQFTRRRREVQVSAH